MKATTSLAEALVTPGVLGADDADGRPPALVDALLSAAENRSASMLVTTTAADLTGEAPHSFQQWARDHSEAFR